MMDETIGSGDLNEIKNEKSEQSEKQVDPPIDEKLSKELNIGGQKDPVEIKLIKSQLKVLWITQSLTILVLISSIAFSFYTYKKENTEVIYLSAKLDKSDYISYFGSLIVSSMDGLDTTFDLGVKFNVDLVNIAKNPISIIASYIIEGEELNLLKKKNMSLDRFIHHHKSRLHESRRFDTIVMIEPGESYKFNKHFSLTIDNKAARKASKFRAQLMEIDSLFESEIELYGESISDIMSYFYYQNIDIYNNIINFSFDQKGYLSGYQKRGALVDEPIMIIFESARGNFFSVETKWYSGWEMPYLKHLRRPEFYNYN